MKTQTIREIAEIREHPTVVRLDALRSAQSDWITQSYCLTPEVRGHVTALKRAFAAPQGLGAFVIGQYGSGKSHFLAWVIAQLERGAFVDGGPQPVYASLLNFPGNTRLEEVVCRALGLPLVAGDRRDIWAAADRLFPAGAVLLLDELSEFLRSKPDARSFNEDVRFLQYMGEWAADHKFWIVAALQEQIERTGDIEHDIYRKIKDRFPMRLLLTATHIRDLIADGILIKKPGYDEAVRGVIAKLKEAAPEGVRVDEGLLAAIYPLHPATLDLLEEVRDQFSMARGAIDFAVRQLGGDPDRGISPFLDRPLGQLLTPDAIIDHYEDLLRLQPVFVPLAERLFPYYFRHMAELFDKEGQRVLAHRLVKLLALCHLSPRRQGLSAREAVYYLSLAESALDPERNVKIVSRLLGELVQRGQYVKQQQDRYLLDLTDDSASSFERLFQRELKDLETRGEVLFEELLPHLAKDPFGLLALPRDSWQLRTVRWHFHERPYALWLGGGEPPKRDGMTLCVRLPWGEAAPAPRHYSVVPGRLELSQELRQAVALARLSERPLEPRVKDKVSATLADLLALLAGQIRAAYEDAKRFAPGSAALAIGRLRIDGRCEEWLAEQVRWMLGHKFPSFERFAPLTGPLPQEAYRSFMRAALSGDITERGIDENAALLSEAYLVPMGLLRRTATGYALPVRLEKQELVRSLDTLLEQGSSPQAVYEQLAQPIYGLVPDQVHALLAFLVSQGEIEITKGRQSYREIYETMPIPVLYDRVERGTALDPSHLGALSALCRAQDVAIPQAWTPLTQRRAILELGKRLADKTSGLHGLLLKLERGASGTTLAERLGRLLGWLHDFVQNPEPFSALRQLLLEVGAAERLIQELDELWPLTTSLERLLSELGRFKHLLSGIPAASCAETSFAARLDALGEPPQADAPTELQRWIAQAGEVYEEHVTCYARAHERFWQELAAHPALSQSVPQMAALRHLGLGEELEELRLLKTKLGRARCQRLTDLTFHPVCGCGFDGRTSPVEALLDRLSFLHQKLEQEARQYFAQHSVRQAVKSLVDMGLAGDPATRAYTEGRAALPQIADVSLLEQKLAGLEVVTRVPARPLVALLGKKAWNKEELTSELERWVQALPAGLLKLDLPELPAEANDIASWCLERSLRTAWPLPKGLAKEAIDGAASKIEASWLSPVALARLDQLGLGAKAKRRVLELLLRDSKPERAKPVFRLAPR